MKKFLGFVSAVALTAALMTGCNNSGVPYRELADAVKDANEAAHQIQTLAMGVDSTSIVYDELTNTVEYNIYLPGIINAETVGAHAADLEDGFVRALVTDDEQGLCNPILNAKSNVRVNLRGQQDSKFEIEIENKTIADAKAALIEE